MLGLGSLAPLDADGLTFQSSNEAITQKSAITIKSNDRCALNMIVNNTIFINSKFSAFELMNVRLQNLMHNLTFLFGRFFFPRVHIDYYSKGGLLPRIHIV